MANRYTIQTLTGDTLAEEYNVNTARTRARSIANERGVPVTLEGGILGNTHETINPMSTRNGWHWMRLNLAEQHPHYTRLVFVHRNLGETIECEYVWHGSTRETIATNTIAFLTHIPLPQY